MKSDVIVITNQGEGFEAALEETRNVAAYKNLIGKETLQLQLITEEMLSMARMVSGEMKASFWIECEGKKISQYLMTNMVLDKKKRAQLINASSSRKNEAAKSFLGKLRDQFEQAMAAEPEGDQIPYDVQVDVAGRVIEEPTWDEYECSVLRKVADDVKVAVVGEMVVLSVSKSFAK